MKNYPRIHSLSTVGLIHHQENDYEFHSTRTDFIGDSGSGKSIVADLLQLIFVGSAAFKSATATLRDKRDSDGLVLTTPGKGINIGYAFLNIAVADEQFIVIGAYFESTSKYTKPFIIQTSTEIENEKLVPMHIPLKASDFKNAIDIYDLEELYEAMEEKQLVFKKWERISAYHRILYNNNILPLNLTASEKALNDYAKIIQSFSRGKTLNTRESKSLLDFLFGNEKAKELHGKYIQIVKDLETTILSYGQNLDAINLLTRKYQRVASLKALLEIKNSKEKAHLTEDILFHRLECKRLTNDISTKTEKILNASYCLKQLTDAAKKDIAHAQRIKDNIDENAKNTLQFQFDAKREFDTLRDAEKLLIDLNIEEQFLESFYEDYQNKKERNFILQELQSKLSEKNLQAFFEQSEWIKGIEIGNKYLGKRISEIESNLEQLNLLLEYADINNPDSLVRWAISLNRPLTKPEESILLHFQTLKRTEPEVPIKGSRYLPSPEILFEKPDIEEKNNGFWINLKGIREYITYVAEQQFNTVDKDIITRYFESQSQNIEQQKKLLQDEQKNLNELNTIFSELSNASYAIEIYKQKKELNNFKEIQSLNIEKEKIKSYLSCLKRKKTIEKEYEQSQQKYNEAIAEQTGNKLIVEKLPAKIAKAEKLLNSIENSKPLLSEIAKLFFINQISNYDLDFYLDSDDKVDKFQTEFEFQKEDIDLLKTLGEEKSLYNSLKSELSQLEEKFQFLYNELPSDDITILITGQTVQQKKEKFIEEKAKYETEFNDIIRDFIPSESYKFEGENKDFSDLIANLLPDIFGNKKVIEEDVISKIENHLNQINNKNRDLNSKKIRKIEDLLDDVQIAVSGQADIVRKINRFFNDGEKKISGNYIPNLDNKPVKGFPISWLSDFKNTAGEQLNLFEISIADKLSTFVSIEEKIKQAFRELTDNRDKDLTIEDLLNPNSYMELSLDMRDVNGKSNKGSTGQTYTAIASLCIARLSIVGSKHYEKDTGIRFMPIDEAEGLGSNFEMLYEIAQKYDYQIVTFAINPLGRYDEQFIYILHRNPDVDININYMPMAIRSRTDLKDDLKEIIEA